MSPRDIPQLRPFFLLFLLSLLSSRNKEQLTSENSNLIVSFVVKNTAELTILTTTYTTVTTRGADKMIYIY